MARSIRMWPARFRPSAELLAEQKRYADARPFYTRALRIRERALGAEHPYVARTPRILPGPMAQLRQPAGSADAVESGAAHLGAERAPEGLSEALVTHAQILSAHWRRRRRRSRVPASARHPARTVRSIPPAHRRDRGGAGVGRMRIGKPIDALDRALRGERIGREHSRLTLGYLAEREALDYVAKRQSGLDVALSLAASEPARRALFDELVRGRSLALDEIAPADASSPNRRVVRRATSGRGCASRASGSRTFWSAAPATAPPSSTQHWSKRRAPRRKPPNVRSRRGAPHSEPTPGTRRRASRMFVARFPKEPRSSLSYATNTPRSLPVRPINHSIAR